MTTVEQLAPTLGLSAACDVLSVPRSRVYRARQPQAPTAPNPASEPVRALSNAERDQVRDTLNSDRFADRAPREVYATLLDEGTYLCSPSTMYRILAERRKCASVVTNCAIRPIPSRNCWRRSPIKSGVGTSPTCSAQPSGPITTCT
jgi:hypothetical protein